MPSMDKASKSRKENSGEELRKMQEALEEEEAHFERRRSFGSEAEPQKFHVQEPSHPELRRGPAAVVSHVADESSVMPLPNDHEEEDAEADEMWDMDWSAVAGQSSQGPVSSAMQFHPPHRDLAEDERI